MTELEEYYNKFNEEKRLDSRHGRVEFLVSMEYIKRCLDSFGKKPEDIKILDVGAGTGRYSIALSKMGYDVTAVELVKHNLGLLKAKNSKVLAYQGDATKLKKSFSDTFDLTLCFGPMYHLFGDDKKALALSEARRVTKSGGYILVAYVLNEYAIIKHGFMERNILKSIEDGHVTSDFHVDNKPSDLYDYVRLEDIDRYNSLANLRREKIIAPDGVANYMRRELNALSEEEFDKFIEYQKSICERADLIGASGHALDILRRD